MSEGPIDISSRGHDAGEVRQYRRTGPAKAPFKFRLEDSEVFTVNEPDSGTMMEIESPSCTTRTALKLFLGEEFDAAEPYLEAMPMHGPEGLTTLIGDLFDHFGLNADKFQQQEVVNRQARRRRRRG